MFIKKNLSEIMQQKDNLKLIQLYWDEAKTKPNVQYHVDQFGQKQGEEKRWWYSSGQIGSIFNYKNGVWHGKYQDWWPSGTRWCIGTNHFKKRLNGTRIYFKYE